MGVESSSGDFLENRLRALCVLPPCLSPPLSPKPSALPTFTFIICSLARCVRPSLRMGKPPNSDSVSAQVGLPSPPSQGTRTRQGPVCWLFHSREPNA